jgi:DNA-directed RNA polymerase specialized sigma24 family protein
MKITEALQELISDNLTTQVYNYLFAYNINTLKRRGVKLPNHLTIEDIASEVITLAYNARDQFNKEIAYHITWYNTILFNKVALTYNTYFKNGGMKRIPSNEFVPNTFKDDNNNDISIFDTLELIDETSFDMLFNASENTSEVLRKFILEKNLDVLYARLYQIPVGEAPNGTYRKYNLITYEELAIQFDMSIQDINNILHRQTYKVINHFTKPGKKERKKSTPEMLAYQKAYREKKKLEKINN